MGDRLSVLQNRFALLAPSWTSCAIAGGLYLMYVRCCRYRNLYELDSLYETPVDAESAHPIYRQLMGIEFPFLVKKSLEFGLFKTYGIPSISKLLAKTGELIVNTPRRYDDTDLLVREFSENPPHSRRAHVAIQRLNYLHGMYPTITNDEYLYVLAVFIVEPIRWISLYGWRDAHEKEKISSFLIWKDIGIKMGIKSIPNSFAGMETYLDEYETRNMAFAPQNAQLAQASTQLFLSVAPSFLHPLGENLLRALCSARLRRALGYGDPPLLTKHIAHLSLLVMSVFIKYGMLPRSRPLLRTPAHPEHTAEGFGDLPRLCPVFDVFDTSYPSGYRIDELGPERYATGRNLCPLVHDE